MKYSIKQKTRLVITMNSQLCVLAFFVIFSLAPTIASGQGPAVSPTASWKPGTSWALQMEKYDRHQENPENVPPVKYKLIVPISGQAKLDGVSCFRVNFQS